MMQLQIDAGLSSRQMGKVAAFIRKETKCPSIIEPAYEVAQRAISKEYTDLFEHREAPYMLPDTPMVICTDVSTLFQRIQAKHGRTIRSIHHGVDSGTLITRL